MADKRITKKEYFEMLKEVVDAAENVSAEEKEGMTAFLDRQIETLARAHSSKSMTAQQKENADLMVVIKEALAAVGKPVTISELADTDERLQCFNEKKVTNQRLSALMNKMVHNHELVKTIDKKKSYFSIATK